MTEKYRKILVWGLNGTYFYKDKTKKYKFADLFANMLIDKYKIDLSKEKIAEMAKASHEKDCDFTLPFVREYGLNKKEIKEELYRRIPIDEIEFENALDLLHNFSQEQYVLTRISKYWADKLLRKLNLYDFFKDRIYYYDDFIKEGYSNDKEIFEAFCSELFVKPEDCIIIEDINCKLKHPKEIGFKTIKISVSDVDCGENIYYDESYKTIKDYINNNQ